jgi:hypothetical protein
MILIVCHEGNEHVERVRSHLTTESIVIDTAWFPASLSVQAWFDGRAETSPWRWPTQAARPRRGGGGLESSHQSARPASGSHGCHRSPLRLVRVERGPCSVVLAGLLLDEPADRGRGLAAEDPAASARPATRSLHSRDPGDQRSTEAQAFIEQHGPERVVRKAFRNIPQAPRTTALVRESDLALIGSVRYAPVIFQRFVRQPTSISGSRSSRRRSARPSTRAGVSETDYRVGLRPLAWSL